jgi:ribosomal protein S18 acetylase RimI-like enzyme
MSDLILSRLSPADMRAQRAGMASIHQAAFDESDELLARYRDRDVPEMSLCPGLQCVAAFRGVRMVGFVIGYDAPAIPAWFDNMMRAVRGTPVASWLPDAWYLADIAVLPQAQRAGVGTQLHNCIMPLVSGRRRMLVSFHGDHPAKRFYTTLGWREVLPDLEYLPNTPLTSLMEYCPERDAPES